MAAKHQSNSDFVDRASKHLEQVAAKDAEISQLKLVVQHGIDVVHAAEGEIERLRNEQARLSAGLTALNMAPKTAPASVLRSVAYDIAFNLIDGETAEFQIKRRAGLVRADQQSQTEKST